MRMRRRDSQYGFSLAELVIVLAVIAILAAFTLSRMSYHRRLSQNNACNGLMSLIKRAADAYYAETGGQLATVEELVESGYLAGHPSDPHDTKKPYEVLKWEGEQVRVRCPLQKPDGTWVYFPPGHQE